MNSKERVMNRLRGVEVDRVPNFDIMMTFAAHFVKQPLSHYYLDYRVLCEANLAVLQAFDLDIVQAISDPYREAADFGSNIEFPHDGLPLRKQPLLIDPADLKQLKPPDPTAGRRMGDRLAAIHTLHDQVGDEVPVMGWVEGAFAEAADLRGESTLLVDLIDRPAWVRDLLEVTLETAIAFARAQIEAGADIIGLGDALASQVSPKMYRTFALPYEQRIFKAVRDMGALARLHICGNTTRLLADMAQSGADIVDLDWMVDLTQAAQIFGEGPAMCGNFDPVRVMLQGTPDLVREAVAQCLRQGGSRLISGAGCEIPDGTPPANLHAQSQVCRSFGATGRSEFSGERTA